MADISNLTDEQIDEWLLDFIENSSAGITEVLELLKKLGDAGKTKKAEECAEMLHETLLEPGSVENLLSLMNIRASWKGADPEFKKACESTLLKAFEQDRPTSDLLKNSGFQQDIPARECLRRFSTLRKLTPGTVCYEATWGTGTVSEIDSFDKQFIINFEKKSGHRMAFSYAGEKVKTLSPDSIMYLKHKNRATLDKMVAEEPGTVVKTLLKEFGPMSAPALQETLLNGIVEEKDWKRFWAEARKTLKADPMVDIPAKRAAMIRLLDKPKEFDDAWFGKLQAERDLNKIMELLEELEKEPIFKTRSEQQNAIISERVDFVISGASRRPALLVEAFLFAERNELTLPGKTGRDLPGSMMNEPDFIRISSELTAKALRALVAVMQKHDAAKTTDILLNTLPDLALGALPEAMDILIKTGNESTMIDKIKASLTNENETSNGIICWLARNIDYAVEKKIGSYKSIMNDIVSSLGIRGVAGEELKIRNQIKNLFEKDEWLQNTFGQLDPSSRQELVGRIKKSPAWDHVDRGAVLVKIVRMFPEVEKALVEKETETQPAGRYTSIRSYIERQNQLKKIVDEEIPANSRDIGIARSHGDLRENADYKAAKEQQSILMRRQADLEQMLMQVMQTDFSGFPHETAGYATRVTIKRPDNTAETFNILGEWDNDEDLNIISSASRIALSLAGKKAGETAELPCAAGVEECVIEKIEKPPENILAWARGN